MSQHVLLERAHRFEKGTARLDLMGWTYRRDIGAWVDADNPEILMVSPSSDTTTPPKPDPRPKPVSKKCDHETGEDMKGT